MATNPLWHSLDEAFKEAAKQGKDPDNVHAHKDTIKGLSDEINQGTPIERISNPHSPSRKAPTMQPDDVEPRKWYFSENTQ